MSFYSTKSIKDVTHIFLISYNTPKETKMGMQKTNVCYICQKDPVFSGVDVRGRVATGPY